MADYTSQIRRSTGSDPLVQQPSGTPRKARPMATPDAATMRNLLKQGKALKNAAGAPSFNIQNAGDLDNAIRAVGRVRPNTDAARAKVRRYIIGRAKALGLSSKIPPTWNSDGDLITPAKSSAAS